MNPNSKPISLSSKFKLLNFRMTLSLHSPVMMDLHIYQRFFFLSFENPSFLCKPQFSLSHPLRLSSSTEHKSETGPPLFDFLLHEHQFSPEAASRVASALSRLKSLERSDSILTFLRESGFSTKQLEKIVTSRPLLLRASLDKTIKPKIEIFQDFGFDANDIAEIISKDPGVLTRSGPDTLIPALSVLKGFLGSSSAVAKVLKKCGWFLKTDLQKNMIPNIEFLKSCGVEIEQIIMKIYTFHRLFVLRHEKMKKIVKTVDEMGLSTSSGLFITALRTFSSMGGENWKRKLKLFEDLGFSEDEILEMFRKAPQVFALSERKLKKVMEVLLASGKYDISCIAGRPLVLASSVEKRINPRIEVLTILENKSLLEKWPRISVICEISDKIFYRRFVEPLLKKVEEVYMLKGDEVRNLYPLLKELGLNQNTIEIFVSSFGVNLCKDSLLDK